LPLPNRLVLVPIELDKDLVQRLESVTIDGPRGSAEARFLGVLKEYGGYLLADRTSGRLVIVATWASEADLRSAESRLAPAVARLMRAAGVSDPPSTERYEVIGQASGNLTARPN